MNPNLPVSVSDDTLSGPPTGSHLDTLGGTLPGGYAPTRPDLGPGSLAATTAGVTDTSFDLSLRLLTALISAALVASVCFLVYANWLAPRLTQKARGPVAAHSVPAAPQAIDADADAEHRPEVLIDPRNPLRCEEPGGSVSYSDEVRPDGNTRCARVPAH